MFINECLRLKHPIGNTERYRLLEDVKVDGITIKKEQRIKFYTQGVHLNPNEWHQPFKFIPERFDPNSKYFKTPSGKNRNEYSFIPFHFGDRKCLG